ncbi:MAG: hypothetical protein HOA30_17425 [Rhodospirillaceae bacterium]|jgi:phospholipid transport system substrate-binding protein|nr:hypothetical protein [Rhodospirillaceae bacterium]MBT7511455.1 hypothetical protein [Rhodospirillaceae bacterium]
MLERLRNVSVGGLLIGLVLMFPQAAMAESASAVVKPFQDTLLGVMKKADQTTILERYEQLAPWVEKTFHLSLMAQIATGKHWGRSTKDEKSAVAAAFRRMSIATLATLFNGYSGEVFAITGEKPGPSKTTVVMTELRKTDKSIVSIAYVAREIRGTWRLIDAVVDGGISELKVRRSEYHLILKNNGMDGLAKLLNSKADELTSKP